MEPVTSPVPDPLDPAEPSEAPQAPAAPAGPSGPGALRPCLPSPVREIEDETFARHGVRLLLKRDDLIHPDLPGNKWRKLAPNLRAAAAAGERALLTFGGAYSNHLRATAAAGRLLGFATIGVVRGDELAGAPLNPSLARCAADGMRLHFVDRGTYRRKNEPDVLAALHDRFGAFAVIPEGGSNSLAAQGCAELGRELRGVADTAAVACGTGGTLAGLAAGPRTRAASHRRSPSSRAGARTSFSGRSRSSSARRSAHPAGTGGWRTASTAAGTPGAPLNSTRSPMPSRRGTVFRWSASTWRSCCSG